MLEIRRVGIADVAQVVAAQHLFDGPARSDATRRFLELPDHHLLLAFDNEQPVGFVSGVEITHPDKGTEMFLYELAVDEAFRRRGIGRTLVAALAELAVQHGCYGMWVGVDSAENMAAVATYRAAGAQPPEPMLLFNWTFEPSPASTV
jgi:ribosomal-protein-alanine N-acetyltransferase